jgi:hypothetical protein
VNPACRGGQLIGRPQLVADRPENRAHVALPGIEIGSAGFLRDALHHAHTVFVARWSYLRRR